MKIIQIILGIGILLLCAAGYRYIQITPYPIGTGEEARSPDGRYTAHITAYYDKAFWGGESSWYEFELQDSNGEQVRFWKTDTIPHAFFGSRAEANVVRWLDNSTAARFTLPGIEITMKPQQGVPPYVAQGAPSGER